ncbi:hypothetical protein [Streptomyces sp. NBC_00083]|uniref:hypothetical protein n=1 Tax=Streptomyces sp. NBC_00083 TaxID=2975647 RepID=UPI0022554548|nr:hypothetical protein [Streptomyces sp. NBC_00083]MCX5383285.1 hypothetical protein [Streptomyces sp. NBC_00083]
MSRRVSLPGADELFRTTGGMALSPSAPRRGTNGEARVPAPAGESEPVAAESAPEAEHTAADEDSGSAEPRSRAAADAEAAKARRTPAQSGSGSTAQQRRRQRAANRRPSGRERHDEKITVYVSAEELMDLEHARLVLRGEHGLAVDRGRIVREAVAVVLADLESRGDASILVRRLRGR